MSDVTRYVYDKDIGMVVNDVGQWVRYTAYSSLEKENEILMTFIEELGREFSETITNNKDLAVLSKAVAKLIDGMIEK